MIRRPMMYITSVFAVTILISYYYSVYIALLLTAAAVLFLFSSSLRINKNLITFCIILSMVSGIFCYSFSCAEKSAFEDKIDDYVTASFVVSQSETVKTVSFDGSETEYVRFTARIYILEGQPIKKHEKVIIKYYGDKCADTMVPGSFINIKGTIDSPAGRSNPGCFDYALYLDSMGIEYVITAEDIEVCYDDPRSSFELFVASICGSLHSVKEGYITMLETYAGAKTAGIMSAVLFGDTGSIDEDILESFRKNGTAHVMAVSGLHVGIIYSFLCFLWRWKKGRLFLAVNISFFMVYMILASFSPSVVRAVIMVWLHIFADLTNRRYDMASAAFFTALIMLIKEPMYIFNTGFQMSFLAVLTLSLIVPVIKKFYSGLFLVSVAVQIGLTPYIVYVFNYFSLSAIVVNVPIIAMMGLIVPIGMCSMAMILTVEPLGILFAKVLGGLCIMLEKLNSLTCIEGITVFDVKSPDVWIVAVYYLVLLVFVSEDGRIMIMRKKKKLIRSMIYSVIVASLMFSLATGNHFKDSDVVFVDVGQGDCIHIRVGRNIFGSKYNYLSDGGGSINYEVGEKTLKPYLLKNGAKTIDGAFVTHLHTDHYKGIAELCREGMIERLYVFEGYRVREKEIMADTGLSGEQITYLHAGQKVLLGRDSYVEVLWPDAYSIKEYERLAAIEEDENSMCLIMKITVKNRSILVTGDVDSSCLDSLAARYGEALDTDILKVAHHGSKYSESAAFVEAAEPEYAVFQVGKNNFGHPDEGVVENFRQKGIMIYRNDLDGAVAFDIGRNGRIRAGTVKGE